MQDKSKLEKIAGSLPVAIAANLVPIVAAVSNPAISPAIALLPFLTQTLASKRQSDRLDACLKLLCDQIDGLKINLEKITDDQYKLAAECSLHMLSTINPVKLDYLRLAVLNALCEPGIADESSEVLSRLMRDISAAETLFTVRSFQYRGVLVVEAGGEVAQDCLRVLPGSSEEICVGGLIRLGLLHAHKTTWGVARYEWSPLTAKLIALVMTRS